MNEEEKAQADATELADGKPQIVIGAEKIGNASDMSSSVFARQESSVQEILRMRAAAG